uniref:Uncharacterized protein n=1 Tax=Glossina pallidipes TaxID=7398 RepID=A0A1B0A325_GLOPL
MVKASEMQIRFTVTYISSITCIKEFCATIANVLAAISTDDIMCLCIRDDRIQSVVVLGCQTMHSMNGNALLNGKCIGLKRMTGGLRNRYSLSVGIVVQIVSLITLQH